MFIQALYKTFLEESRALTEAQLRYVFYYLLERVPAGWAEEQLGGKLMFFVKEMLERLRKGKLPHYFIAKTNMLNALPKNKLTTAQQK